MLRATPQRTPRGPLLEPTPMIALEMTWVVETGIPKWAVTSSTVAAVVSAAKPWIGSSSTTLWPIVRMIRQPPTAVPSEMAVDLGMGVTRLNRILNGWLMPTAEEQASIKEYLRSRA